MIGYGAKERVDGKLILPEAVQILKLQGAGTAKAAADAGEVRNAGVARGQRPIHRGSLRR